MIVFCLQKLQKKKKSNNLLFVLSTSLKDNSYN